MTILYLYLLTCVKARTQGSWDQTIGSGKEMVGNLIGSQVCTKQNSHLILYRHHFPPSLPTTFELMQANNLNSH